MKIQTPVPKATKNVIQVRYRNPRGYLEIFWAEEVWDIGNLLRFTGCRTSSARLNNIAIPTSMVLEIVECDMPSGMTLQN